ncbi:MAG: hypothetical protein AAGH15_11045 [Myxococcota bacterium]
MSFPREVPALHEALGCEPGGPSRAAQEGRFNRLAMLVNIARREPYMDPVAAMHLSDAMACIERARRKQLGEDV